MLLFNHSSQPQYFNVRVADNEVLWLKAYKLGAMETKAISINRLISERVKDDKGRVLPENLQRGEASWLVPATTEVSGRILQSNVITAMARNFSCGTCDFLCHDPTLDPDGSLLIGVGDAGNLGSIAPRLVQCNLYASS